MKSAYAIILIILFLGLSGFENDPVASGKTHCCLGNYTIEEASEPMIIDAKAYSCFIVNYENSDRSIMIGVDRIDRKCSTYIVRSEKLAVQYECNAKYFGVNKVKRAYGKSEMETSDIYLNKTEYYHQKVISRSKLSEVNHLKLISVYFPKLINDYEIIFAVK